MQGEESGVGPCKETTLTPALSFQPLGLLSIGINLAQIYLAAFFVLFLFGGPIQLCSKFTPDNVLRDHS